MKFLYLLFLVFIYKLVKVVMLKPRFIDIDRHYNTNYKYIHSCTMSFKTTSAIRMCEALAASDLTFLHEFKRSAKNKCPHGYIIEPADLITLLSQPHLLGIPNHTWKSQTNGNAPKDAKGKSGIIYFLDIPGHTTGDHIDLWHNKSAVGDDFWDASYTGLWTLL